MWDLNSPTRDQTHTPCIGRQSLNHWTTREVPFFYFRQHSSKNLRERSDAHHGPRNIFKDVFKGRSTLGIPCRAAGSLSQSHKVGESPSLHHSFQTQEKCSQSLLQSQLPGRHVCIKTSCLSSLKSPQANLETAQGQVYLLLGRELNPSEVFAGDCATRDKEQTLSFCLGRN